MSAVHAEISWRAEGFVLLARGGRLVVDGRGVRALVLDVGRRVALAPGLVLDVLAITPGEAEPTPPTLGRDRLRFVTGPVSVRVYRGTDTHPEAELLGVQGRLLGHALTQLDRGAPWASAAGAIWPEDAVIRESGGWTEVDERRFRNRWDQALVSTRRTLAELGRPEMILQRQGFVFVELGPLDTVDVA